VCPHHPETIEKVSLITQFIFKIGERGHMRTVAVASSLIKFLPLPRVLVNREKYGLMKTSGSLGQKRDQTFRTKKSVIHKGFLNVLGS